MPNSARAELLGFVFDQIARFGNFFVVFLGFFLFILVVFGERNDVHRMHLRHLELDVALRATENLAFFYFVFIQVHLGVAFGTLDHGHGLLLASLRELRAYYIPRVSSFYDWSVWKCRRNVNIPVRRLWEWAEW